MSSSPVVYLSVGIHSPHGPFLLAKDQSSKRIQAKVEGTYLALR